MLVVQRNINWRVKSGQTVVISIQDFTFFAKTWRQYCYSQLGQDLWVTQFFGGEAPGYFVEIGAYDGLSISNTYLLEKLGWKGLLIEPNPNLASALRRNRICELSTKAVTASGGPVEFKVVRETPELSRLENVIPSDNHEMAGLRSNSSVMSVDGASIANILAENSVPSVVTYVSIDTEGSELDILETFPFYKYNVKCFTIEHNYTSSRERIRDLMHSHGYVNVMPEWTEFDDWYVLGSLDPVTITNPFAENLFSKFDLGSFPKPVGTAYFLSKLDR